MALIKDIRKETTKEKIDSLKVMDQNLRRQDDPKVGIFWYDVRSKSLFGVVSVFTDSIKRPNVGGGLITCKELHKDIWKKEFNKQRFKNSGIGPFRGDYKDTPRGRVFYDPNSNVYQIKVGSWIEDHPEAIQKVVLEFNLESQTVEPIIGEHWEIGVGYGE